MRWLGLDWDEGQPTAGYRQTERAEIYRSPLDDAADRNLQRYFDELAPEAGTPGARIAIGGRMLRTREHADGVVWFDFDELCVGQARRGPLVEKPL